MRWPPVPPPARSTLNPTTTQRGTRNAERGTESDGSTREARNAVGHWRELFRVSSVPPSPNADQDTGRDEGDEQARPPVGDEWQRDARGRKQGQAHTYVQRRGHPDQGGEPHGQELAERVTRRKGDAEAEPHERAEQHEQGEHAQETPFLTDGRENEVGVGIRQVAELLLALPEADAEQPSRPDADERLVDLPGGFGGSAPGIEKRDHPRQAVLRTGDGAEHERRRHHGQGEKVPDSRGRREPDDPGA